MDVSLGHKLGMCLLAALVTTCVVDILPVEPGAGGADSVGGGSSVGGAASGGAAEGGSGGSGGHGPVTCTSCVDDGCEPEIFATMRDGARGDSIVADDTTVYVYDVGSHHILAFDADSGVVQADPIIVGSTNRAQDLALDGDNVYWVTAVGVYAQPRGSATVTTITTVVGGHRLGLDDDFIYWVKEGTATKSDCLFRAAKRALATPQTLYTGESCVGIGVDVEDVWTFSDNGQTLIRAPKEPGAVVSQLLSDVQIRHALGVGTTFLAASTASNYVTRIEKSGFAESNSWALVDPLDITPDPVAADSFFVTNNNPNGRIHQVIPGTSCVIAEATDSSAPNRVAANSTYVFWTSNDNRHVRRKERTTK